MKNTNKYNLYLLGLFTFLFIFTFKVGAEQQLTDAVKNRQRINVTSTVSPFTSPAKQYKTDETPEQVKNRIQEFKPPVEARREQMSSQVMNNMINMLNTRVSNAVNRLNTRAGLLNNIISQIETRISLLETSKNIDLTNSREYINMARVELQNAETLISNISVTSNITTREELQMQIANLKVQVDDAHQSLKKVLDLLKQAIASAKELSVKSSPAVQNNIQNTQ